MFRTHMLVDVRECDGPSEVNPIALALDFGIDRGLSRGCSSQVRECLFVEFFGIKSRGVHELDPLLMEAPSALGAPPLLECRFELGFAKTNPGSPSISTEKLVTSSAEREELNHVLQRHPRVHRVDGLFELLFRVCRLGEASNHNCIIGFEREVRTAFDEALDPSAQPNQ